MINIDSKQKLDEFMAQEAQQQTESQKLAQALASGLLSSRAGIAFSMCPL